MSDTLQFIDGCAYPTNDKLKCIEHQEFFNGAKNSLPRRGICSWPTMDCLPPSPSEFSLPSEQPRAPANLRTLVRIHPTLLWERGHPARSEYVVFRGVVVKDRLQVTNLLALKTLLAGETPAVHVCNLNSLAQISKRQDVAGICLVTRIPLAPLHHLDEPERQARTVNASRPWW